MKKKKNKKSSRNIFIDPFRFIPDAELDFHDYDMLYPYDIEKILEEFIEDSYVGGYKNLLVITGKGAVVRPTVERKLKDIRFIRSFKRAGYYNGQDGAFEIVLVD